MKNCYHCERKNACFTASGLAKLKPDDAPADCDALFTDFAAACDFFVRIGDALDNIPDEYRYNVFFYLAGAFHCDVENILTEFYG